MLLERNQVVVGLIFAALLGAATLFSVTVQAGVLTPGYTVSAEFAESAGVGTGDKVMVAGVRTGEVTSVEIVEQHVRIEFKTTAEMPADSRAEIVNTNPLGAPAVQLVAGDDWSQLLENQDEPHIPLGRTSTPVDVPELNEETVKLLRESDADALRDLIISLADVTEGQRDELDRLLDGLREVSGIVTEDRDALAQLVRRSEDVVGSLADRDQDLVRIVDAFGETLDVLAQRRDEIRTLLTEVRDSSRLTADLLSEEEARLDRVLNEVDVLLDIVDSHQVDLAHAFAYGGVAFEGFAGVGYSGEEDNPYWGNIQTTGIGPAGVDAFAGCGGALDQMLDQIFGPKPCPDDPGTASRSGGSSGGSAPDSAAALRSFLGVRP